MSNQRKKDTRKKPQPKRLEFKQGFGRKEVSLDTLDSSGCIVPQRPTFILEADRPTGKSVVEIANTKDAEEKVNNIARALFEAGAGSIVNASDISNVANFWRYIFERNPIKPSPSFKARMESQGHTHHIPDKSQSTGSISPLITAETDFSAGVRQYIVDRFSLHTISYAVSEFAIESCINDLRNEDEKGEKNPLDVRVKAAAALIEAHEAGVLIPGMEVPEEGFINKKNGLGFQMSEDEMLQGSMQGISTKWDYSIAGSRNPLNFMGKNTRNWKPGSVPWWNVDIRGRIGEGKPGVDYTPYKNFKSEIIYVKDKKELKKIDASKRPNEISHYIHDEVLVVETKNGRVTIYEVDEEKAEKQKKLQSVSARRVYCPRCGRSGLRGSGCYSCGTVLK